MKQDNKSQQVKHLIERLWHALFIVMPLIFALLSPLSMMADSIDDLETLLRDKPQVQEKIYVHTDNNSYFIGDTLWYKAYVVRADDLTPTNLSKLLYVELLTPDGIVVERQHVVVNASGVTCGQFALPDSLYSGYYEIRAYTRWQLNFNVTHRKYSIDDKWKFLNKQAADDYFRDYEGLYSRVLPVYSKPTEAGNFVDRYMARRPKQRVLKEKDFLVASFYPEGGALIEGIPCRVAFEVTDNNGQGLDLEGRLTDGTTLKPQHLGRGIFTITPTSNTQEATFIYKEKTYRFKLPKALNAGIALSFDNEKRQVALKSRNCQAAAYAVLCRGKLIAFQRISSTNNINLANIECPTGINEIIIYDAEAQPLASRLFFVNNHDYGVALDVNMSNAEGEIGKRTTLQPYSAFDLNVKRGTDNTLGTFSIAVRDAQTDDPGYNDGNIMTDMLLSSELKGFIAFPAYYFAADDAEHRNNLDLLMMVQGWRRYKRVEKLRYAPELGLTYEGTVNKLSDMVGMIEITDMENVGKDVASSVLEQVQADLARVGGGSTTMESETEENETEDVIEEEVEFADNSDVKIEPGKMRKQVLVEAEINKDGKSMGAIARTDKRGRFIINLPPYYDSAVLFVKAYSVADSAKKCMESRHVDKDWANERAYPDYFVKRDMFFPIFSNRYSWYQVNSPEIFFMDEDDDELIPEQSRLAGNHTLQTVVVKSRRRGKRGIDMTKPAIVRDAYSLYNDVTDYGLSYGVVDFRTLSLNIATYFFGNMGRRNQFNIRAMVDGSSFYRNYQPMTNEFDKPVTPSAMYEKLRLNRMQDVRVFTDYELRTDSGDVQEQHSADVTLDFVPIPDNGKRYTYRDRRYILPGITYPEEFYSPNYSNAIPTEPKDYRRTLYWNPNAHFDADGKFDTRIYNNCRETRITVSVAGVDGTGQMYYASERK